MGRPVEESSVRRRMPRSSNDHLPSAFHASEPVRKRCQRNRPYRGQVYVSCLALIRSQAEE
jgi:hypothetical protein